MNNPSTLPFDCALMEAITDMVFIVSVKKDSVFKYEFFNRAVFEKTHLTDSHKKKTFQEVHNPKLASFLERKYTEAIATGEKVIFEDSYASPSGERYYSESTLTALFDKNGTCAYIIGVVKDITTERLAKQESLKVWTRLTESRSRYRSLYENNADAIFFLNLNGQVLAGNEAAEKVTGFPLVDLIGTKLGNHVLQKDTEILAGYFQKALDGVFHDFRTDFTGVAGQQIGVLINFAPVTVKEEIVGVYAIMKDMRELDKMASQYIESENRFRLIAENVQDVIILMNLEGKALYVSPSCKNIYGLDPAELLSKTLFHNVHPDDMPQVKKFFSLALLEAEPYLVEARLKNHAGNWIWSEVKGTPVFDEHHQFIYMLAIMRDITLQKEHETQLRQYAFHDSLTGLPNRRFLKELLSEKINECQNQEDNIAVILLDIDRFKDINDQFGHEVGDAVIEEFGKRLSQSIGEQDVAARLGGDEFVLLLPDTKTAEQAKKLATKIQSSMKEAWLIENGPTEVTASMGIALTPLAGATPSSLLKNADLAMYESKEAGRSTYRFHHS